jgi:hypothetical protein
MAQSLKLFTTYVVGAFRLSLWPFSRFSDLQHCQDLLTELVNFSKSIQESVRKHGDEDHIWYLEFFVLVRLLFK